VSISGVALAQNSPDIAKMDLSAALADESIAIADALSTKMGAMSKIGGNLADLHGEHRAFTRQRSFRAQQSQFTSLNPMLQIVGDKVVIDAVAAGDSEALLADLEALGELLLRAKKEGLFRRDMPVDLEVLARSLWIVSRYWMDHLREFEGVEQPTWDDLQRGLQHHFAVLVPHLTANARRDLESAVFRVSSRFAASAKLA